MSFEKTVVRRLAGAAVVACGIGAAAGSLAAQDAAQTPPVLLVLDETAIDHGPPPHLIPFDAVNDQIATNWATWIDISGFPGTPSIPTVAIRAAAGNLANNATGQATASARLV